ncbi:hypothetical protein KR200_008125 [Drosophila serrata]|nr:hypothetical protein KR200_008125 [Drosophila serrata]
MVQSVGQRSSMHHRLDNGNRVHHWHGVNHRHGVVDNWSSVDNGNGVNHWSRVNSHGLQDWSHNGVDYGLAVHLGDALVGHSRRSRVHHSSYLGQDGLMDHMVGLDQTSAGGGNQEGNDGDLGKTVS